MQLHCIDAYYDIVMFAHMFEREKTNMCRDMNEKRPVLLNNIFFIVISV